jgi:peptidoglycan/LPS O-acetylase OafA/YrhL
MIGSKGRLHELDSLRALAAIGVIGWHYTNHFQAAPLPYLMAPFYRHGLLLVDFFFVLSGYVLARTYWTDERSGYFTFNIRDRIARIYPLHFAMLCIVALLQWVLVHKLSSEPFIYTFNDKRDFVLNLMLLNRTGLERGFSYNATSWSISTEFVVNILFLAAIVARRHIAIALLAASFAVALAVVLHNGLVVPASVYGIDNDVFRTVVGFMLGVALYRVDQGLIERAKPMRELSDLLALGSIVGFLYYCARGQFTLHSDLLAAVLCFPALIVGVTRGAFLKTLLTMSPLVYLGTISYSIYLVHYPLQLIVHIVSVWTGIAMPYRNAFFLLSFLGLTIAIASMTYRWIEVPGKRLFGLRRTAEPVVRVSV